VTAGTYLIQVGAIDWTNGRAVQGGFDVAASFAPDTDLDNDGYPAGPDCNDRDPAVHPGARDVPHNGRDEDCRGGDNLDGDNDGHPAGPDCNDRNHAIHPHAGEVTGNWVDEDCDGAARPAKLDPDPQFSFPNLWIAGRGLYMGSLTIKQLRRGYRVRVRCRGRGCTFRKVSPKVGRRRTLELRQLRERFLQPGARVEIQVTWPGRNRIGSVATFKVRRGKRAGRSFACLYPQANRRGFTKRRCR
jgi:hypothetical protein